MIVLKITNSSELLAAKVGKFLESLTPDGFDGPIIAVCKVHYSRR